MTRFWIRISIVCAALAFTAPVVADDAASVRAVIDAYAVDLNNKDVEGVLDLYAPDAVFVPNGRPTSEGDEAIRKAYSTGFSKFDYGLSLSHNEATVAGDIAWARVFFGGTLTPKDSSQPVINVSARGLFVLARQSDGAWKIIRYMFNSAPKAE